MEHHGQGGPLAMSGWWPGARTCGRPDADRPQVRVGATGQDRGKSEAKRA
ncbi:hypothetical protein GCM10023177_21590 [Streptomyces violaceoruber]